jgi:hypothetical protein
VSIEGHPIVDRLAHLRTLLEKLKPIEQKLKYQIDKVLRQSESAVLGQANDPLQHRPNAASLVPKNGADEDDSSSKWGGGAAVDVSGIYRPPKLAAMPYGATYGCFPIITPASSLKGGVCLPFVVCGVRVPVTCRVQP